MHIATSLATGIHSTHRRVALYGVDQLIEWKKEDQKALASLTNEETIRRREELADQIRALKVGGDLLLSIHFPGRWDLLGILRVRGSPGCVSH